jgi:hypothetical protein
MKSERRVLRRGVTQVDTCPGETGLILSVGPLSLWLKRADALDVVELLAQALAQQARDVRQAPAPEGLPISRSQRIRRPSRDRRQP